MEYVRRSDVKAPLFDAMHERSKRLNEENDCSVKAVAIVCGVTYDVAHEALEYAGRKHRKGAFINEILYAIGKIGKKSYLDLDFIDSRLEILCSRNYVVKKLTTRQLTMFPDLIGEGTWLIYTNGHVLAVKDGQVHCWGGKSALHIKLAYKVT